MTSPRARGTQAPPRRFFWAQVVVGAAFFLLAARLWQLQVLSGDHYFRKSADNFVKELPLLATRGQILDRKGRVLADNRPSYDVYVTPRFFTEDSLAELVRDLHLEVEGVESLKAKVAGKHGLDRFRQVEVLSDVSRDDLAILESDSLALPGVSVTASAHREYPEGTLAAHLLGYMNEITAEELSAHREQGYHPGDFIGRSGLEREWESYLRGKDGSERVVVDAKGRRKSDLEASELESLIGGPARIEPQPGDDLETTIDLDTQRIVENALKPHHSAAAAVIDVETGRVLALASWPEPDPNALTGHLSRAEMAQLIADPARPLIDKTVRENYFPGSTFKVVPALAGLESRMVDPDERVICHGAIQFGRRWFHCVEPHGPVNLHLALVESCNVFFYGVGDKLGLDRMAETARDLGFGAPTGLGINGEVPGFIPTMDFYKRQGAFQKGVVLNTAIGQGSVKVTVLQLAMAYAAIANGGRLYVPQLVDKIVTPSGQVVQELEPRLRRVLAATPDELAQIRSALFDAVNAPKGTSYAARIPGLEVAGKTGTAQVGNHRVREAAGSALADHAWFASFAPARHPKIAVVVLVEHGGFGAKSATPAAMEIYRHYFAEVAPQDAPHARLTEGRRGSPSAAQPR